MALFSLYIKKERAIYLTIVNCTELWMKTVATAPAFLSPFYFSLASYWDWDVEVGAHGQDHIPTLDILSWSRLQSKYLRLIILVDIGNARSEIRKLSVNICVCIIHVSVHPANQVYLSGHIFMSAKNCLLNFFVKR